MNYFISSKKHFMEKEPKFFVAPVQILGDCSCLFCFVFFVDPDEVIYDDVPRENSDSEPGLKSL